MSKNGWTPGPWEIRSNFVGPLKIVAAVDAAIDRSGQMEVAHVGADTFEACQANARLIAAAPELAAALEQVLIGGNHLGLLIGADHPFHEATHDEAMKHYGSGDKYEIWCCWRTIMNARLALSKARGET